MKSLFPGYYRPNKEAIEQLWKESTFTFDANVLLNLYRYRSTTRESLLSIFEGLQNRVWLSNQAALEYQENRTRVILDQFDAYNVILEKLGELKSPKFDWPKFQPRDEYAIFDLDITELQNKVNALLTHFNRDVSKIRKDLDGRKTEHPKWIEDDPIRERLDNLFDGKVGEPYPQEVLIELYKQGFTRYESLQPPGFMDNDKPGNRKYGDFVMWRQIIDYAKRTQLPIIMVTDDQKDDWWEGKSKQRIGAHPALMQEIYFEAGIQFHLYTPTFFMKFAEEYLQLQSTSEAKEEVAELEAQDLVSDAIQLSAANLNRYLGSDTLRQVVAAQTRLNVSPPQDAIAAILRQNLVAAPDVAAALKPNLDAFQNVVAGLNRLNDAPLQDAIAAIIRQNAIAAQDVALTLNRLNDAPLQDAIAAIIRQNAIATQDVAATLNRLNVAPIQDTIAAISRPNPDAFLETHKASRTDEDSDLINVPTSSENEAELEELEENDKNEDYLNPPSAESDILETGNDEII